MLSKEEITKPIGIISLPCIFFIVVFAANSSSLEFDSEIQSAREVQRDIIIYHLEIDFFFEKVQENNEFSIALSSTAAASHRFYVICINDLLFIAWREQTNRCLI